LIINETWKLIDDRKALKIKFEQSHSSTAESMVNYRKKEKQVKKNCRKDKQVYLENKANEAEAAALVGDSKTLYHTVKDLSGVDGKSGMPIKDDNGKTLSTHEEQVKQWRHHFEAVLNCPELTTRHNFHSVPTTKLDIFLDDSTVHEIRAAIRKLKNNKAASIDNILAEYMKHGGEIWRGRLYLCSPYLER